MRLACIVGARPNFMKIAPILRAMKQHSALHPILIHTGQHYDANLSDVFFDELEIQRPDISLGIGSGSHAQQTANILVAIEKVLVEEDPPIDRVIVVGDVNSTMAATIAATKLQIPVAHVEAGLRSFDRSMPEEINRILTDSICDMLFVSEPIGVENLRNEGHKDEQIHLVGNVMIDTLLSQIEKAKQKHTIEKLDFCPTSYAVVTLHRPANVDSREVLSSLINVLIEVSDELPLAFPIHPRTKSRLEEFGLDQKLQRPNIKCLDPLGYLDFLCLTSQAKVIVTDSGGLQEESTVLGIPCLTMRPNTERPVTVDSGTSTLIGSCSKKLKSYMRQVIDGKYKSGRCPELWDGKASERVAAVLLNSCEL